MSAEERQKWNIAHTERGFFPRAPSKLLTARQVYLPRPRADGGGKALDVAGGSGRHALWLADRGFDVTLVDISEAALQIARDEAAGRGIPLATICADLGEELFPPGPWDVILCFHYLQRSLFGEFAHQLAPGGVVMFVQPTVRNLERHPRPGARFLLDEGELSELAAQNHLDILFHEEGWSADGRHEAVLIARSSLASSTATGSGRPDSG